MVYQRRKIIAYMRRIITRLVNIMLIMAVFATTLSGCSDREIILTTGFSKNEVMRINNKSCYLPEMMLYLTTIQNQYEEVYGTELWKQSQNGVSLEQKVKDMVLAKIAQVKVMNLMAESYELKLDETEELLVSVSAKRFFESLNDREKELIGVTEDDVCKIYSEYALANKVYDYVIKDINPEISDDEARTITVWQILIKTYALDSDGKRVEFSERTKKEALEKAQMVRDIAISGEESFEALAAKYNEGDEMTYTFKRGEMAPAFEEAAFSLDKDKVSDIVETEYGYHVLKCVSNFDVAQTQANKVEILKQRKEAVFDETYDAFLATINKTLNDELYESIQMIDDPLVVTTSFFDVDF